MIDLFPEWRGKLEYVCLNCGSRFPGDQLLYTCPDCGGVFLLEDTKFKELKALHAGDGWQEAFDRRKMSRNPAISGVFRFYELIAPVFEQEDIVYLGEANTPLVWASEALQRQIDSRFAFKNDGQNPSASFKDRGMACAFSCLKWLCRIHNWDNVLTICASTGDTSAAAALYASYVGGPVKSVVLLPEGKVTPQQLSQPLGSGATVIEIPGVFDDCMKVVEFLAETYNVALLNSKNPWRILGQESYSFELAQALDWDGEFCAFIPIGNAGNITALMSGFLKMHELGIIDSLPRIFGVQSEHADPVYRYYEQPEDKRTWNPVEVQPSVAQAAMIGNPVSFPRVRKLAAEYGKIACKGQPDRSPEDFFKIIRVTEQQIMDAMLLANRNGHIACTQGGECLAGLILARKSKAIRNDEKVILDSTAHALKFIDFQNKYFANELASGYGVKAKQEFVNRPEIILSRAEAEKIKKPDLTRVIAEKIASGLGLEKKRG